MPDRNWPAWLLMGIFATVVATSASDYSLLVPEQHRRYEMHDAIVSGTAPSPQRFRILVPWLLHPVIDAAAAYTDREQAFRRVYFAFHFAALTALIGGVYLYSRLWFSRPQSLIGALVVASTLRLVLRMGEYWDFSPIPDRSWFAPWSLLEPVFVAAALLLLARRQLAAVAGVTIAAAANSEASFLIPLFACVLPNQDRRDGPVLMALWFTVTVLIRAGVGGFQLPSVTVGENLSHLPATAVNLGLFLGAASALIVAGFAGAPRFARRALLASAVLTAAVAIYGYWWDVRLLTPLYPVVAPVLLAGIFQPGGGAGAAAADRES
ncbi:MAG TPA: hypothetical protein VEC39_07530 [Vicinamibacterales bacterium]|nr:hypothetical protein [Vicinamibacterales bacterium]